ncbi:MAG: amino acid-binding protein [Rhizobiales bacterium]|nr:amino acid-binding protein [Hyphomicrobiales bacterium]
MRVYVPILLAGLLTTTGSGHAADLVIGIPSWSSAKATAHVIKEVLEDKLKLDVELKEGTNEEIFAGMDDGTIDIHPEVWLPNLMALHDKYVIRRKSAIMSEKAVPGEQGLCVTRHTAEGHGIRKIEDLADPGKARKFDTDGDGRGELWVGDKDWASTRIEKIRARSYGHAQTMQLLEADETVAMAAVDAAVAVDRPIVFYCYAPHHVFSLHEIVFLEEPPHDPRDWRIIDPAEDAQWLTKSNAAVGWAISFLHVTYSSRLAESQPRAAQLLSAMKLDVDTVSSMTYAIVVEGMEPSEFARQWVATNGERVDAWLAAK